MKNLLFVLALFGTVYLQGQTVNLGTGSGSISFDGTGQTISQINIKAGTYSGGINLANVKGVDSAHPVVIINSGGQVICTGGSDAGLEMWSCRYFHVTGTGVSTVKYGFLLTGGGTGSFDAHGGSSDGEIDHIECGGSSYAGLIFRTYPNDGCQYTVSAGWSQNNTNIHDNYVHSVSGEGMYIGVSHYGNQVATSYDPVNNPVVTQLGVACAKANEGALHGVHIWNNIISNVGRDGIQLGGAVDYGTRVDHNIITNFAMNNESGDDGGITINPGTRAIVENNWIEGVSSTNSEGMMYQGQTGSITRNNVFKNCTYGIFFGRNTSLNIIGEPIGPAYWYGNDFINCGIPYWLFSNNFGTGGIVIQNNLAVGYSSLTSNGNGANYTDVTNYAGTFASAGFLSTTDYHLTATSPLLKKGTYTVNDTLDYTGSKRNNPPNQGAYDSAGVGGGTGSGGSGGGTPPPPPPPPTTLVVNVTPGVNQTLAVPSGTTSLQINSAACAACPVCPTCPPPTTCPPARTINKTYLIGNVLWGKYTSGSDSTKLGTLTTTVTIK